MATCNDDTLVTQRIPVSSATKPTQLVGASPTRMRATIRCDGPWNVRIVSDQLGHLSQGFRLTPNDQPIVLVTQCQVWVLAEDDGFTSHVSVIAEHRIGAN